MANKKVRKTDENAKLVTSEISIKSLFYLLDTSNHEFILTSLIKRKSEMENIMKSKLTFEELVDILKAFINVYNLKNSSRRLELLSLTQSEEFISNIKNYLININNIKFLNHKEVLYYIVQFVDVSICELPQHIISYESIHSLIKMLIDIKVSSKFCYISLWAHELNLLLQNKFITQKKREITRKNISIFPTPLDLYKTKDLTPNRTIGAYENVEGYLDIMFKLLKEDFESSVREDLFQMKMELRGANLTENTNLLIYKDVYLERIEIDRNPNNGLIHRIVFSDDNEGKKQMGFNKKIFRNGSLLFFSGHNQFTTFFLGSVIEEVKLPSSVDSSKVLRISVVGDPMQFKPHYQYTMIEPRNFFEPYFQVLKALQSLDVSNFPMEKYIINCNFTPCLPSYISVDTVYCINGQYLKLFGKEPWPNNLLNLDFSQLEALRSALTHEFVLIRGAPGTGKTFLTQILIDILIENKSFLTTPILLISSKNNSVDRILETLFLKGRKVVRLGGQTKSLVLKKCLLSNLIQTHCLKNKKKRIESLKETLLYNVNNQNASDLQNEIKILDDEKNSYLEFYGMEAAKQLLNSKIEIIGGTTAGCARMHFMLKELRPEVVIVENANEVLESHVICNLSKGCKHLILIGDHEQLKPTLSNRISSDKYCLDISLFERMERCGIKSCTLTQQYRMRPEIASLISPAVYKKMKYHPDILKSPKIKGMNKNLFFIDHEVTEDKVKEGDFSFSNTHEADMLLALADYLLKQGYSVNDITVLVPYSAQQIYMVSVASKYQSLHGLEIEVVDNYSGQENKIILLSLVRSHSLGIGFLSIKNRIVVALSRAKWGLYIIGNMKTLIQNSDFCASLNSVLKKRNAIGKFIPLECETHKTTIPVSKKEDFVSLKNRGCYKPCDLPLDCGHFCKLKCHTVMEKHKTFICREPCTRTCDRNIHKCEKKCFEECGQCSKTIEITLPCGHSAVKSCSGIDPVCSQSTMVNFLCCITMTVPCYQAESFCFSRV